MANLSNINGKFVVDTAGNIGVGTLTPRSDANTTNISIQSSGTARLFVNNTGASGKEYAIYSSANGDFGIFDYDAVSARLVINSSGNATFAGNVGIGAAASDGNLHVRKTGVNTGITNVLMNANFADGSNGTGLSIGYRTDETTAVIAARTATGNIAFYSYDAGWSESMRIKNNGNVGIGTDSPSTKLEIFGNNSARNTLQNILTINGGTSSNNVYDGFGMGIKFNGRDYSNQLRDYAYINSVMQVAGTSTPGGDPSFSTQLQFWTNTGGAVNTLPTQKMVINALGNVGINVSNPGFQSVDGYGQIGIEIKGGKENNQAPCVRLHETGSGKGSFELRSTRNILTSGNYFAIAEGTDTFFAIRGDDDSGGVVTRGYVGIGTTSPGAKLDISESNGGILLSRIYNTSTDAASGSALRIASSSTTHANSNTIQFSDINYYTATISGDRTQGLVFRTSATGSNPITIPERMRITSDGFVRIGNPSAVNTYTPALGYVAGISSPTAGGQTYLSLSLGGAALGNTGVAFGLDAGGASYYMRDNKPIRFYTNNTFAMTIAANGNVSVGDTTAQRRLNVIDPTDAWMRISASNYASDWLIGTAGSSASFKIYSQSAAALRFNIDGIGRMGFNYGIATDVRHYFYSNNNTGAATGVAKNVQIHSTQYAGTHVQFKGSQGNGGTIGYSNLTASYNTTGSDERLKKNITDWDENILDKFKDIQPKEFHLNQQEDTEEKQKGYIAQNEVDKFPEAYPLLYDDVSKEDRHQFNPSGMVVYLMKAMQELKADNDSLKARIEMLENN